MERSTFEIMETALNTLGSEIKTLKKRRDRVIEAIDKKITSLPGWEGRNKEFLETIKAILE